MNFISNRRGKYVCTFLISFVICFSASAQLSKTDSLEALLRKGELNPAEEIEILNTLGYLHFRSDPARARTYAEKALKINNDPKLRKDKVSSHNLAGNTWYLQGNFARALEHYLAGLKIMEALNDQRGIANGLLGVGNIYATQKNYPLALEYQLKSLKINESLKDSDQISGNYNNIGVIYLEQGDLDKALEFQLKSLLLKELTGDEKGQSSNLGNIGTILYQQGKYPEALRYQKEALAIREKLNNRKGVAMSYLDIGRILEKQDLPEEALEYMKKGVQTAGEVGYKVALQDAYLSMAGLYEKTGQPAEALRHFKLHSNIKDSVFNAENASKLIEMQTLYESESKEKEIRLLTREKQVRELLLEQQETELLKERLEADQRESQIELLSRNQKIKDLVLNKKEVELSQQKLISESKEKELRMRELQAEKDRVMRNSLLGGSVLLASLSFLLFREFRTKQKRNKELGQKNREIVEAYSIIERSRDEIAQKNKDITDSINYAQRIQQAILPPAEEIRRMFPESFVMYRPKDIVCGDFYWFEEAADRKFFAAVDCTGHGVPGAFMSLVGNNLLNQAVREHGLTTTSDILDEVNRNLTRTLRQHYDESSVRDGMDVALVAVHRNGHEEKMVAEYSGANNSLWIYRKKRGPHSMRIRVENEEFELVEIKGDKFPVGIFLHEEMKKFTRHQTEVIKGDILFVASDGYADQFGGPRGKKFKYRQLYEKIFSIAGAGISEQKDFFEKEFDQWKGDLEQVDDVLLIGVRI